MQVNFFVHDCCLCRFSQRVRKVSPAALEQCSGSLVVVLQSCCKVAPRPLEKVYGRPRKLFTEPLERCRGREYSPPFPPQGRGDRAVCVVGERGNPPPSPPQGRGDRTQGGCRKRLRRLWVDSCKPTVAMAQCLQKRGRYIVRRAEAVSRESGARRHQARLGVRIGGSGAKVAARQWGCQGRKPESFRLNPALPSPSCVLSEPA